MCDAIGCIRKNTVSVFVENKRWARLCYLHASEYCVAVEFALPPCKREIKRTERCEFVREQRLKRERSNTQPI